MNPSARPAFSTTVDCASPLPTRRDSTYKSGKVVQTSGATSVGPVLLGKQIGKDPMPPALCQDDRAVHVLVQPLLEHTSAQIVSLPPHDLVNRRNQRQIADARLPRRLAEPGRLESSLQRFFQHGAV